MPIGFKNNIDGSLYGAANAMLAASQTHHFLEISHNTGWPVLSRPPATPMGIWCCEAAAKGQTTIQAMCSRRRVS